LDTEKATDLYVDIVAIALAFPIVVHDFMSFAQLFTKYQSPSLIVYCDKNDPDYEKILEETFKARQNFPLKIEKKDQKANPNHDLTNNLLFIVSTQQMLIPLLKLPNKTPRVILAFPEFDSNDIINLRDNYWKFLTKIDGMASTEFFQKVADKSKLKEAKTEDEFESAKAKFSEDRYKFTKTHSFSGRITASKITTFIEAARDGKLKPYFESEDIPEETFAERVVGEDFKKKILQSDHDCVVFLEHPTEKENLGYHTKFEKFVKNNQDDSIKFYRIKDYNETDVFKLNNYQSPTVLYFKKDNKISPIELDIRRDLLKQSNTKLAFKRLSKFVSENSK
jgi:hypothetical protein